MKRFLEALLLCPALVKAHAASAWIDGPNGPVEILYEVSSGKAIICNTHDHHEHDEAFDLYWSHWYGMYDTSESWDQFGSYWENYTRTEGCAIEPHVSGSINIPSIIDGYPIVGVGKNAFHGCSSVSSIVLPEGVLDIGENAFAGCSNLEELIIPNSVTNIANNAFTGCSALVAPVYNSCSSILWYVPKLLQGTLSYTIQQ